MNNRNEILEEAAKVADAWIVQYGKKNPSFVSPQDWANGAILDIADAIRRLKEKEPA